MIVTVVIAYKDLDFISAGKYGIYSLLDMHQDALSDKFCGEGIPDWAVDTGSKGTCDVGIFHQFCDFRC